MLSTAGLCALLLVLYCGNAGAQSENLDDLLQTAEAVAIGALGGTIAALTPISIYGDPLSSFGAESGILSADLALKYLEAPLRAPESLARYPNTTDECHREFTLPQSSVMFANLFGLINLGSAFNPDANPITGIPDDWGELGRPDVYHANTEVWLTAYSPHIEISGSEQTVLFPAGNHRIDWTADTVLDPAFDIALPTAMLVYSGWSKMRSGEFAEALARNSKQAAKQSRATKSAGKWLVEKLKLGIKTCTASVSQGLRKCVGPLAAHVAEDAATDYVDDLTEFEFINATRVREQTFTVWDVHPPTLEILQPTLTLEAMDFGGTTLRRVENQLFASVAAEDACDRPVSLHHDLPVLLPLGPSTVTWTASDLGPVEGGSVNTVSRQQQIIIEDTQAPILVPPPGRVIEVEPDDTDASDGRDRNGIDPGVVNLGVPRVVDLADPIPTVGSDAPAFFPVNTRTEVQWSATDHGYPSPNTSFGSQLITVKAAGTNTAPVVEDLAVSTLTAEPIDILLSGLDFDELDGRVDPISFAIVDRPGNGEFIAPLLPYFIEDYRTNPAGPYGEEFLLEGNRTRWLYQNVCSNNSLPNDEQVIALDWVYHPEFVHVTDDGTVFMIDTYWKCNPSDATGGGQRISKWDRDGGYLGQTDYNGTTDAFVMDQDGFIYTLTRQGAGSSTTLTLTQIRPDFDVTGTDIRGDAWRFDFNSADDVPVANETFSYARVDSSRGLIYLNDRRRVLVFDVREDLSDGEDTFRNGMLDQYLGALNDGEVVFGCTSFGSSWTGFAMEVDSAGNLYVADTCADRIHKFAASGFDADGEFLPGEYLGWMGRCDTSSNKACDEDKDISKGYSCTDATCSVSDSDGEQTGQFSTPVYLALDPNDILYVADFANSRIQRFATDGSFAGEAASTGTGINQGERPSFILGNIGPPKSVSVNSTQFFVVDTDESFLHVFETTPLKDISDSSAVVSYVSNFDFHSATDSFSYAASDGLATSNIATVSVTVDRNYRPPLAEPLFLLTEEDLAIDIELLGDDPDGIYGEDFNGLDTLSFRVLEQPAHGELSGTPPLLSYTPMAGFFGIDRFSYVANDGNEDSAVAEVVIEITAVDDPIRVTGLELPEVAGRGFPVTLMGKYEDDGAAVHDAYVFWGDTEEVSGDFVDPDGDGELPPRLDGLKVMEPPGRSGEGMVIGQHLYDAEFNHTVTFCMNDESSQDCRSQALPVREVVNLAIDLQAVATSGGADYLEFDLLALNVQPEGYAGMPAGNVRLEQFEPEGTQITSFSSTSSGHNCSLQDTQLSCAPGTLKPGDSLSLRVRVEPVQAAIHEAVEVPLAFELSTASAALQRSYTASSWLRFEVDDSDSDEDGMTDRFEDHFGLDAGSAQDAELDSDADGLSNLREFDLHTDPTRIDTDGDGVADSRDEFPLDPTQSGDLLDGDLNIDDRVDAADLLILQQLLFSDSPDPVIAAAADLNVDGETDAADLLLLQRLVESPEEQTGE